jgi:hypothetical protein
VGRAGHHVPGSGRAGGVGRAGHQVTTSGQAGGATGGGGGGWAPGRRNSRSTRRRSRGSRPLGRRSYERRSAWSLEHRRRRSAWSPGRRSRESTGRRSRSPGVRHARCFFRTRRRPLKVPGGLATQKYRPLYRVPLRAEFGNKSQPQKFRPLYRVPPRAEFWIKSAILRCIWLSVGIERSYL